MEVVPNHFPTGFIVRRHLKETQTPFACPWLLQRGRLEKRKCCLETIVFKINTIFFEEEERISLNHQNKSENHERVARTFWSVLEWSPTTSPRWRLAWRLASHWTHWVCSSLSMETGKMVGAVRQQQQNSLHCSDLAGTWDPGSWVSTRKAAGLWAPLLVSHPKRSCPRQNILPCEVHVQF